jgi:hypothetical protein
MVKEICTINIHGNVIHYPLNILMKNVSSANSIHASEILIATSRLSSCRCYFTGSQFRSFFMPSPSGPAKNKKRSKNGPLTLRKFENSQETHDKTDLPTDLFHANICWQCFDTTWLDDDDNIISHRTTLELITGLNFAF